MKVVVFFILFFVSAMKNLLAGRLVVILKLSIRTGRDEVVLVKLSRRSPLLPT